MDKARQQLICGIVSASATVLGVVGVIVSVALCAADSPLSAILAKPFFFLGVVSLLAAITVSGWVGYRDESGHASRPHEAGIDPESRR